MKEWGEVYTITDHEDTQEYEYASTLSLISTLHWGG
jgi:hypothetical protein